MAIQPDGHQQVRATGGSLLAGFETFPAVAGWPGKYFAVINWPGYNFQDTCPAEAVG